MKHYDYVIAGGGLAGLSLACRLAASPLKDRTVLIVDHAAQPCSDRTFSFWANQPTLFDDAVCRSWQHVVVAGRQTARRLDLDPFRYRSIRGADFHRCASQQLAALPAIECRRGHVRSIVDGEQTATVDIDGDAATAAWVFDSIAGAGDDAPDGPTRLKLVFTGWEIEAPYPTFDCETATLMDFRTPQQGDLRFFYVLPFSANRALVEYTAFTGGRIAGAEAHSALANYLAGVLEVPHYRVVQREAGCLPIPEVARPRQIGSRVMALGLKGGLLKATTGYAFTRVQADSAAIVASLVAHGHPFDVPESDELWRRLDAIMLRVMAKHGDEMHAIMETLFEKNPPARILRFLDEAAPPVDVLRIMTSLPPGRFIEAALGDNPH